MQTSIILEGIDGVGKSTLALKLQSHFSMPINNIGGPPHSDEVAYEMSYEQVNKCMQVPTIFDRITSLSRLRYERQLDSKHELTMQRHARIMCRQCYTIWCHTSDPKPVKKDYKSHEHMEEVIRDRHRILNNYRYYMTSIINGSPFVYDFVRVTVPELIEQLEDAEINKYGAI